MPAVSFSIIGSSSNIGAAIRSGDTVTLRVIRPLAGGMWQVSHNGKLLAIRSTVTLSPGQWIRTRAEVRGGSVLLRLVSGFDSRTSGSEGETSPGVSRGGTAEILIQAFRRAGMFVDGRLFELAKSVFENTRTKNRTTAGVITALAEKRISPETAFADYIAGLLDNPGNGGHRGSNREGGGREKERRLSAVESIRKKLKSQIERSADEEGLLQLFNHMKGPGESWILIPYDVRSSNREVRGVIRLRIDKSGNVRRIGIGASVKEATFSCSLNWPIGKSTTMTVRCSDKKLLGDFFARSDELPEKLRNLVSNNDDNSIEDEDFDHLGLEDAIRFKGVDELA